MFFYLKKGHKKYCKIVEKSSFTLKLIIIINLNIVKIFFMKIIVN